MKRYALYLILACLLVSCTTAQPVRTNAPNGFNPFTTLIHFYRGPLDHLSAVRIGECPMYPSDSEYSLDSFRKHGMLVGWMMSVDRLMRCGRDETRLSPKIWIDGKPKTFDPVRNNDFWWREAPDRSD